MKNLKLGQKIELKEMKEKYYQYSEKPEQLKELLKELNITIELKEYKKYFDDDTEKRIVCNVEIKRKQRKINFDYGLSLNDSNIIMLNPIEFFSGKYFSQYPKIFFNNLFEAKKYQEKELPKILDSLLYSILCCCASEYEIDIDFDDFCDTFGYNNDSIKHKKIWESCLKQSSKLQKIFNNDEIVCLPR